MSNKSDISVYAKYKNLYRDIIFGYSEERFKSTKQKVFIKHLSDLETGQSERAYQDLLFQGKEKGLKTEKETINFLIEEKCWSESNEEKISSLSDEISRLKSARDKLIIKSQLSQLEKDMKPLADELYVLDYERRENLGMTTEVFANKKISEETIQSSFFKDRELTELFYSEEEFEYLSQEAVNESLSIYSEMVSKKFAGDEIKRVSVCPFFMNTYVICNDNVYNFFGKPILYLTNFQVALMSSAKYFKNLMGNAKPPPEDFYTSPDKIIEWYELQNKTMQAKNAIEDKGEAGGKSLMGASRVELDAVEGENEEVLDLGGEIEKSGGEMNFDQILDMHGIK